MRECVLSLSQHPEIKAGHWNPTWTAGWRDGSRKRGPNPIGRGCIFGYVPRKKAIPVLLYVLHDCWESGSEAKQQCHPSIAPQPAGAGAACLATCTWLCSWLITALPTVSASQEVGTSLAGSAPSMEAHPSYSFEKWMNFCSFKR